MEVSGQLHAPSASLPGKEPLDRRLGGFQNGLDAVKRKISSPYWDWNHRAFRP